MLRFRVDQPFTSSRRRACLSCAASGCFALRCSLSVSVVADVLSTFDQLTQTKTTFSTEGNFKMILQEQYARTVKASFQPSIPKPLLIGCPVCGRPAMIRQQLIGEEVACGHCHGTFVVTEQMDGSKTAQSTTAGQQPEEQKMPRHSTPILTSHEQNGLPQLDRLGQSESRPVAFVVEPRDEVYARLAGDLTEAGYRVVRALSSTDALKACGRYQPKLVVAQLPIACQKAWQLAPKLAMLDSDTRVVLYGAEISVHDYAMADFWGIEHLIEYSGDLFGLSMRIRILFGSKSSEQSESTCRSVA